MAKLAPNAFQQWLDSDGNPLSGGKIYSYEAGTTTPKDTYTDEGGGTANANPLILDSEGRASLWLGEGSYKLVLKTAGDVLVDEADDVLGDTSASFLGDFYSVSTNTTVTATYQNGFIRVTSAATLSLLTAADAGEGFTFVVKADGGDATIDPDGSETINGASTLVIKNGYSALVTTNGTAWYASFYEYNANNAAIGALTSAANKIPYFTGSGTAALLDFKDEDDMASNSATAVPSQQSVKAFVDALVTGKVLQVVDVQKTDSFSSSSTSYTDLTGMSASITPSAASSKVLVLVRVQGDANTNNALLKIVRDLTDIGLGDAASSRTRAGAQISALGSSGAFISTAVMNILDSPATTSATTYKVQVMVPSSGTAYINRSQTDTNSATFARVSSSITLIEVAA